MPSLGPRIRKENEDVRVESKIGRQRLEQKSGLRLHPTNVVESLSRRLAGGAGQTVGEQVNPETILLRMRLRVGCEEMTVPAADLECHPLAVAQVFGEPGAERGQTGPMEGLGLFERHARRYGRTNRTRQQESRRTPCGYFDLAGPRVSLTGSVKKKAVPCPSVLSARTFPP